MGSIISISSIIFINKIAKLHKSINGHWSSYLSALFKLWYRRRNEKRQILKYDVFQKDPYKNGILPNKWEWDLESPNKLHSEDVFIYGVNSSGNYLTLSIKWRPKVNGTVKAHVKFSIKTNDGNSYTIDEDDDVTVDNDKEIREYRIAGVSLEVLSPLRNYRIKVRGYLKKNGTDELIYGRMRILWNSFSNVFDMSSDFSDEFMAKEMTLSPSKSLRNSDFEDRWEQFGCMKGEVTIEKSQTQEVFYWGSKMKTLLPKENRKRKFIRIMGFTKKGIAFHIGLVVGDDRRFYYRYGYGKWKIGSVHPLEELTLHNQDIEVISRTEKTVKFDVKFESGNVMNIVIEPLVNGEILRKLSVNGDNGYCIVMEEKENYDETIVKRNVNRNLSKSLVLSFGDAHCNRSEVSGGKGSSLSNLMILAEQLKADDSDVRFKVPRGIVVSTNAYEYLLKQNKQLESEISDLQQFVWKCKEKSQIKSDCERIVKMISKEKLPQMIASDICAKLKCEFGNDWNELMFAVRSSASGEDSEEMSAAGQMTTYLGVKGSDAICDSVMKCWASQFEYVPVEYKRGYGQLINTPMAVVIQEMVNCDSAGVIFTADPVTGDERIITVTANYGLGETVVSASADPDTIKIGVNIDGNSLRIQRKIKEIMLKEIGMKRKIMKLSNDGGTVEEDVNDNQKCCVNDSDLLRLAKIALKVHVFYGNSRDIEWGIKDDEIFMLQSRPITNLDNSWTEYEIMHEIDTAHPTEVEIYSRAHWGENFPGSSSYTVLTWVVKAFDIAMARGLMAEFEFNTRDYCPYIPYFGGFAYNQLFFNFRSGMFDVLSGYPEDHHARQRVLAFFGHDITDSDVLSLIKEKDSDAMKKSIYQRIKLMIIMASYIFLAARKLRNSKAKLMREFDILGKILHFKTAKEIFNYLSNKFDTNMYGDKYHAQTSFGSSLKNELLKYALKNAIENNPHVQSDFDILMASCNDVISAEVPNMLKQIAAAIEDPEKFKNLSDEDAVQILKNGNSIASVRFKEFLKIHGHRGYRELDPMMLPWRENPIPVVKTIKMTLIGGSEALKVKEIKSTDEILSQIKTPLSKFRKFIIRNLLLPFARDGVCAREESKYLMVWITNKQREALWHLSRKMVSEGLIPDPETYFFLTADEIARLINNERDALLLSKARMRKRVYAKTDKFKFEEFCKGQGFKPRNIDVNIPKIDRNRNDIVKMTGTAVSSGKVKARVCVAEDITEADQIQSGDILITYSTDIGWSPYFPIISGIVTEIGGTISHGAVIAREFGIPCLIAVEGACQTFKTGDIALLDTEAAEIVKID